LLYGSIVKRQPALAIEQLNNQTVGLRSFQEGIGGEALAAGNFEVRLLNCLIVKRRRFFSNLTIEQLNNGAFD
jgi:hypothetical protein